MKPAAPARSLSPDTCLLVRLGDPADEDAQLFLEFLREKRITVCVTPTALAETTHLAETGDWPAREHADNALSLMAGAGFVLPRLETSAEEARVERIAAALRAKGFLPERERHDARILAETSLAGVRFLVTTDPHFMTDNQLLGLSLEALKLTPVCVVAPGQVVRAFSR